MNTIKLFTLLVLTFVHLGCYANSSFDLIIQGKNLEIKKSFFLGAPESKDSHINYVLKDFQFDLRYKKLPTNRSYPAHLDITLSKGGKKVGYLFFALNDLDILQCIGVFGMVLDINGELVDVQLKTRVVTVGNIDFDSLNKERFFQDTLLPNKSFQMIRPVILPKIQDGVRAKEFNLDHYPYSVEYKIIDRGQGVVLFQHNLYKKSTAKKRLIMQIYFQANSLDELREVMYAGKAFNFSDAPAKLVFYPALGQTEAGI